MQTTTINVASIRINQVPVTEEGTLTVETAAMLPQLAAYAALYELEEMDYTKRFLTEPYVPGLDGCPHCNGETEIAIQQLDSRTSVLVPCVCTAEDVPLLTDIYNAAQTPQTPQDMQNMLALEETTNIRCTIAEPIRAAQNLNEAAIATHINNTVALFNMLGYDFHEIDNQQVKTIQIITTGDTTGLLDRIKATFEEHNTLYMLDATSVVDADMKFSPPRILTPTETALMRQLTDLEMMVDLQGILDEWTPYLTPTGALDVADIQTIPQISYNKFTTVVRVLVTLARLRGINTRYDVVNPENRSRISHTYLRDANGIVYQAALYFTDNPNVPTNFTLAIETPGDDVRVMEVEGAIAEMRSQIENLSRTLQGAGV